MADNPIKTPLPADLPTDWTYGQTVAPAGSDAGLSQQHGYNYLMRQVNAAQQGVNKLGEALEDVPSLADGKVPVSQLPVGTANGVARLDSSGKLERSEIPDIDCGEWDTEPVSEHDSTPTAHANLLVDGNNVESVDTSESLEEHMENPTAHQNLMIDGNAGR